MKSKQVFEEKYKKEMIQIMSNLTNCAQKECTKLYKIQQSKFLEILKKYDYIKKIQNAKENKVEIMFDILNHITNEKTFQDYIICLNKCKTEINEVNIFGLNIIEKEISEMKKNNIVNDEKMKTLENLKIFLTKQIKEPLTIESIKKLIQFIKSFKKTMLKM